MSSSRWRLTFVVLALSVMGAPSLAAAQSPAPDLAGVTLTVWTPSVQSDAQKALFAEFSEATGATLDVQPVPDRFEHNLLAKWATGERPDILFFHGISKWLTELNPAANLRDLSGEAFIEQTIPGIIDASTNYNGIVHGAVLNYPYMDGIFYNREVFDRLGLEPPTNFAELLEVCQQVRAADPEVVPLFAGGGDQWPLLPLAFSMWNDSIKDTDLIDELNTGAVRWTDDRIVQGIAKQKELFDAGCYNEDILTAGFADEQSALFEGRAAMVFQVSVLADAMVGAFGADEVGAKIGYAPVSAETDVASWQLIGTGAVYLPKTGDAAREAAALEFVRYATGPGYQGYLDNLRQYPVLEGYEAPADVTPLYQEMHDAFIADSVPQYEQRLVANNGPIESFLQEMIAGTKTPSQVAEAIDAEFRLAAQRLGIPGF